MTVPTFPVLNGITWPVKRTPTWSTAKQDSISGRTVRFSFWSFPKYKYTLTYDVLRSDVNTDWQTLLGFYNTVRGPGQIFQFKDNYDFQVTDQLFGSGDGTTTQFQLVRTLGGFAEPVLCVVGTPTIKVAGTPTAAFTVDTSGVVTFTTAPASGAALTWTGEFNWYCFFDDDQVEFETLYSNFWDLQQINFTTSKL